MPQPETSYTHQITWSIPDTSYTSGTLSLLANDLYDEFIVPQAWILATTKDTTSATAECRIETFLGTDIIGSHGYSFVVNVPPKSTIALSDGPVSANGTDKKTVMVAPTYAGYSHKVTWTTAGYTSGAIAVASGVITSDFAVPLSWNNASPNDASFLVTCTVETFKDTPDGSRSLGSNFKTYTVDVPLTIVPIITSFTAAPVDAYWGLYVKTKSRCTLTPVLQAAYSSPIVSFQIVGATQNSGTIPYATGASWTTAPLQVHGDPITFTVSATDGRNRTASSTVDIATADYASPSITGVTFGRATAAGTLHNQGTYINAKAAFTYSAIGDNSISAKAYYRQLGGTAWLPTAGAGMTSNAILTYGNGAIAQGYLYDVKITLTDYFTTVEHTAMVAKAVKVWDIREDRASFGAFATNPKELYVPAAWDIKVGTDNINIPFVVGTQTTTTASWTGIAGNVKALYNGLTIRYWLPRTSASNVTLDLTLADNTTTGAIPCYYGGTTRLTTHYAAGSMLLMTYVVNQLINGVGYTGWWTDANYADGNTYDRTYWGTSIRAGATTPYYKLLMEAADNKWYPLTIEEGIGTTKTVSTQEFLLNSPILYYAGTSSVAANATMANVYSELPSSTLSYTSNTASWTSQMPIYLRGTVTASGGFKLDNTSYSSFMTQSLPTTDDGFVHILLGYMYGSNSMRLQQSHPVYQFKDGALRPYLAPHTHTPSECGAAPTAHFHAASDIASGILPVARGGTGVITAAEIALLSFAIGAIYQSTVSTSPATLFGGTWASLGGQFLIGADGIFNAGSTGGAATHTHTTPNHAHTTANMTLVISQMPSHTHPNTHGRYAATGDGNTHIRGASYTGTHWQGSSYAAGGDGAHGHGNTGNAAPTTNEAGSLPPYRVVYMWERTA